MRYWYYQNISRKEVPVIIVLSCAETGLMKQLQYSIADILFFFFFYKKKQLPCEFHIYYNSHDFQRERLNNISPSSFQKLNQACCSVTKETINHKFIQPHAEGSSVAYNLDLSQIQCFHWTNIDIDPSKSKALKTSYKDCINYATCL